MKSHSYTISNDGICRAKLWGCFIDNYVPSVHWTRKDARHRTHFCIGKTRVDRVVVEWRLKK